MHLLSSTIARSVASYFSRKKHAVYTELGLLRGGSLRADLLAVTIRGQITIVEIKSSLQDFRSDKKWQLYLPFCHKFYWAMSEELHDRVKDQIQPGCGVFVLDENGSISKVRPARMQEVPPATVLNICIRAAFRSSENNRAKNKPHH